MPLYPLLLAISAALAAPAASEPAPEPLMAVAGEPVALAVESTLGKDCMARETARTRVLVPPKHGAVSLHEGRLRQQGGPCPAAPGYVLLYVAEPEFSGLDDVTIEVTDDGMVTVRSFEITVDSDPVSASTQS
jgi:hypothetical protein